MIFYQFNLHRSHITVFMCSIIENMVIQERRKLLRNLYLPHHPKGLD